jgi:hypothetical protein
MARTQIRHETAQPIAAPPAAAAPRSVTCYRVARLDLAAGPILCLVRGLSEDVATLDIDVPFATQSAAGLQIAGHRLDGALVRIGDGKAEFRADAPIEIDQILADPSMIASAGQRALPRVKVDARARIDAGVHRLAARVRDISTDGVKIFTEELLATGDAVRVVLKGIESPMSGTVRWCRGDYAGIEFAQRLPIGRLNAWLSRQGAGDDDERDWAPPVISKS